jgi:hypothetical protein
VGSDAKLIGIVDLTWAADAAPGCPPRVEARMVPATDYPEDEGVAAVAALHQEILKELEVAVLCKVPAHHPLSSRGMRRMQTTVGTLIVTALKQALQVSGVSLRWLPS